MISGIRDQGTGNRVRPWPLALLVTLVVACGGGQTRGAAFDETWSNDNGAGIAAFQQRFAQLKVPPTANVAIGVSGKSTILGVPLDGGPAWSFAHPLDGRPTIAGTVVVGIGSEELFALDARTGKRLWARRAGGLLRGAGDDGKTTVVSLMSTTGQGTTILAVGHDGVVVRQIEDDAAIGVPAVIDTYAFLPWQGQYVTVYDLLQGRETARVLLRTQVSRAFTQNGAVFFGEAGVTRLDDRIRAASRNQASTVMLRARELPGQPRWLKPGTDVALLQSGAQDKIALYARPTASGPMAIEGDRYTATYYKVAVGFEVLRGRLAWAHAHDAEFLAGGAYAGGVALCDAAGKVTFLDSKTGRVAGQVSLGHRVQSCVVQVDGLSKPAPPNTPPLADQVAKVLAMPGAEHVAIQKVLVHEMATMEDPQVTKALIELSSDAIPAKSAGAASTVPAALRDEARTALAARRSGAEHMLAALGIRYDFLADVLRTPPVGPLADALAAMGEKKAAPLLAAHLNDPADSADDARRAAAALAKLAGKAELPALSQFFAHYRGAPEGDAMVDAVVSSAEALLELGADAQVSEAAKDAMTDDRVRRKLVALIQQKGKPAAEPKTGSAKPQAQVKPKAGATNGN